MSAPRFVVREATPADHPAVLALNNAAAPAVNALTADVLDRIVARAAYFRVVLEAEAEREATAPAEGTPATGSPEARRIAGFVLCLPSGGDYWSENYRWFAARYPLFLYLDRVVVDERVRGRGVGTLLYDDLHAFAAGRWPMVALEVNLRPPNPGSDRFHQRLGYEAVGVREYGDDGSAVTMYVKPLRNEPA